MYRAMIEDRIDKRNRYGNDAGAAPIAEKQENQRRREAGGDHRFAHHSADGRPDEARLIEQRRDFEVLRQDLLNDRQLLEQ